MWEYQNKPSNKKGAKGVKPSARGVGNEEAKEFLQHDIDEIKENNFDQPRVSLIRSSDLLSHQMKNKNYDSHREARPRQNFESSTYIEHPSEMYEDAKVNLNMTMKAPLDNDGLNKYRNSSSLGPSSRQKEGLVRSNSASKKHPVNQFEGFDNPGIGDLMKIDPISIPFSKGKLYHYLNFNEGSGVSLNPPIKASPNWFMQVYKSIFRTYSYLQSSINSNELFTSSKSHGMNVRDVLTSKDTNGSELIYFEDIMASIQEFDIDGETNHKVQAEQFRDMNKIMKIREIGTQIRIPLK